MKHTLKSLLITSILTVPSAFGVEILTQQDGADHSGGARVPVVVTKESPTVTTAPVPTPKSIVNLCDRAYALEKIARPIAAARVYLDSLNDPGTSQFQNYFIALRLEKLGYPHLAICAYNNSMAYITTDMFCKRAEAEIERLKQLPSKRSKLTLDFINKDVMQDIVGIAGESGEKSYNSFLTLKDQLALGLVSTDWHEIIQPMIDAANVWRKSNLVPRVLLVQTPHPHDPVMFALFGIRLDIWTDTKERWAQTLLKLASDRRFPMNPYMGKTEHGALVKAIDNHSMLTTEQKTTLKGKLPDIRTLESINRAAENFRSNRQFSEAAAQYEQLAVHLDATPTNIRHAAEGLKTLGVEYHDRVAALYEQSANHPDANQWDIESATDGLKTLGVADERIAELYEQLARHSNAQPTNIRHAAKGLKTLGVADERIAELYEQSASHTDENQWDILFAAAGVQSLGANYHDRAAALYELSANHSRALPVTIRNAADGLKSLGAVYQDRATALLKKHESKISAYRFNQNISSVKIF